MKKTILILTFIMLCNACKKEELSYTIIENDFVFTSSGNYSYLLSGKLKYKDKNTLVNYKYYTSDINIFQIERNKIFSIIDNRFELSGIIKKETFNEIQIEGICQKLSDGTYGKFYIRAIRDSQLPYN
ncbi:MAG: hypothetical protein ACK4GL_11885 [Flavobacteriales bacterium]